MKFTAKLYDRIVVLFHSHCADGISSAAVTRDFVRKVFPTTPSLFFPVNYGAPFDRMYAEKILPNLSSQTLVIAVDVSLSLSAINAIASVVSEFVEVDHHDSTAQTVLPSFKLKCRMPTANGYALSLYEDEARHISIYYSDVACGAIHCNYLFRPIDLPPLFLRYINDRDLWLWQQPNSKEINAAIFVALNGLNVPKYKYNDPSSYQESVNALIDCASTLLDSFDVSAMASVGVQLKAQEELLMQPLLLHPLTLWLEAPDGERLEVFGINSGIFQSELGNKIATVNKPAAIFNYTSDGWVVSLRAHEQYDQPLNVFAQKFGGGGHPKACGFRVPVSGFDGTTFKIPT